MFLAASAIVFVVYFANVALGAFAGRAFLGDVGEMLVLFAADPVRCRNSEKRGRARGERRLNFSNGRAINEQRSNGTGVS